ncbi:MAG: RNA polymerase sigma-54 factor [Lautropia sp.]|nr:RNA polymerase sigma-54 factor [Lautropia sp.]
MKPSLQMRQSQHLALTPQLQQSIRLLQLSTLELNQEIDQILAQNPLLDRDDDTYATHVRLNGDGSLQESAPGTPPGLQTADGAPVMQPQDAGEQPAAEWDPLQNFSDHQAAASDNADVGEADRQDLTQESWALEGHSRGSGEDPDDDRAQEQVTSSGLTLREHLMQQLAGARGTRRDQALLHLLIEELEEDGYLRSSLDDLASALPPELDVEPEELRTALCLLHSFDPPGVGARSIAECLMLQLLQASQRLGASPRICTVAAQIIEDHLELLAAREFSKLRKLLRCDEEELREAQRLIQALDPKPGNRFGDNSARYVVPDVIVRKTKQGWRAFLNPDVIPKLRVNDLYAQILKSHRGGSSGSAGSSARSGATGSGQPSGTAAGTGGAIASENRSSGANSLSSQLQEARWLVKNVQQRFETILKVSQEIVDRQRAFFSHGAVAMRPLVLREVADSVGLHESTISRVTTQKYMLTPYGTLELKYFFGSHVATESGGAASSTAIRALIRQLIEEEDTTQPLSDSRIAEVLGEQGIVVARRTVAKYREALRVPPVAQRKAL